MGRVCVGVSKVQSTSKVMKINKCVDISCGHTSGGPKPAMMSVDDDDHHRF